MKRQIKGKSYSLLSEGKYEVIERPKGKGGRVTAIVKGGANHVKHKIIFPAYLQKRFDKGNILQLKGNGMIEVIGHIIDEKMP